MHGKNVPLLVGFALAVACLPLFGHHGSNPNYQWDKTITVNGVVTEFQFVYPHVSIYFDVKDDKGNVEHWSSELGPTPIMMRNYGVGWSKTAIKPGDQIVLTCNPTKIPSNVCQGKKIVVNGKNMPLQDPKGAGRGEDGEGKQ
jgi:hypothetical protein